MYFRILPNIYTLIIFTVVNAANAKYCTEESTNGDNPVVWPYSPDSPKKVVSNPLCLTENQELVTRVCEDSSWYPKHDDVQDCNVTQSRPSSDPCPLNYASIELDGSIRFCYNLTTAQNWDYPCLTSGSSMTIFDLEKMERELLLNKLEFPDRKLVWLPAKRIVPYGPIVWTTVGDDWGEPLEFNETIKFSRLPVSQNCLLLDLDKFTVKTENCSYKYPSICIFKEDHVLPLHCPPRYGAARYEFNSGRCYGLEIEEKGATWDNFVKQRCKQPLQINKYLENFLFEKASSFNDYDMIKMCWTSLAREGGEFFWYPNLNITYLTWDSQADFSTISNARGAINEKFRWLLLDKSSSLPCMACQVKPTKKDVDLSLQFSGDLKKLFLTIYNPRYLWKDDIEEAGVRCFTNAKGFVEIAEIEEQPYRKMRFSLKDLIFDQLDKIISNNEVEKSVFEIEYSTDESGEYWCEGHSSIDFKLITSPRVLVAAKTSEGHRFALKLKLKQICVDPTDCNPDWEKEAEAIEGLLNIDEVHTMEVENVDIDSGDAIVLYHMVVPLDDFERCSNNSNCNLLRAFYNMTGICKNITAKSLKYVFISLKSTMYCLPDDNSNVSTLHWEITNIGDNTAPKEFCMQSNGLPVTRQCSGSFLYGGKWEEEIGECSKNYEPTNRTTFLYSLAKGKTDIETTSSFLAHDMIEILNDKEDLIPADVYFLSLSLKMIVEMSDQNSSMVELGDTNNIANIMDSIMNIEESCLNLAQTMNSSNVLLESLDIILSKIAHNESDIHVDIVKGMDIAVTPLFVIQISNPFVSNVTGLALARKPGVNSTLFTDMNIIPLTPNMTVSDIIAIEGLEIATWLPHDLLESISLSNQTDNTTNTNKTSLNIIIDIFNNDIVFQETKPLKDIVNSRVISVTIPGREADLPLPLPIVFRRLDRNKTKKRECAYWDFSTTQQISMGQWSNKGCFFVASYGELDVCACFHLTHFAQLVLGFRGGGGENSADVIIYQYHGRALNAITLVGCSLSLVGVAGIAATAVLFKNWRQKPGTKVLLQLSAAIALQSIMMLSQDGAYETDLHCIIIGAMLHYTVLAAFMWMLLSALLQFARYVKVLGAQRPARFMVKFSLAGWGLPLIPVAILLLVNHTAYLPPPAAPLATMRDPTALCYPQGLGLYFSVLLPVSLIVGTNLVVFILVMRSISIGPDGKRRSSDPEIVMSQLRLSILLFFLLGLSWIFGLLAVTGGSMIFSYLFCLTATLQGFVLFIYFVICDPSTRVLWVSLLWEKTRNSQKEITST